MTTESALRTIKHIKKVFYVVGIVNVFFIIVSIVTESNFSFIMSVPNFLVVFAIIFMGWSLDKSYRRIIPKIATFLSILLLLIVIVEYIFTENILGFLFPIALWIIGKQSKQAIVVLENSKNVTSSPLSSQ